MNSAPIAMQIIFCEKCNEPYYVSKLEFKTPALTAKSSITCPYENCRHSTYLGVASKAFWEIWKMPRLVRSKLRADNQVFPPTAALRITN